MEHLAHAQNISSLMGEERQLNSHSGHSAGQHNSRFYFTLHTHTHSWPVCSGQGSLMVRVCSRQAPELNRIVVTLRSKTDRDKNVERQ